MSDWSWVVRRGEVESGFGLVFVGGLLFVFGFVG